MQNEHDNRDMPAAYAQCGDWPASAMTPNTSAVESPWIGSQSNHFRPARLLRSLRRQGSRLALDGPALPARRAVSARGVRETTAFLDAFEQCLAGGDGGEDQRDAPGDRGLDVLDRAGPLDFAERRVNHEKLFARDNAREQDRHGLAVLAAGMAHRHQGAAPDHLPALRRHEDVWPVAGPRGGGHGRFPLGRWPNNGAAPGPGAQAGTGTCPEGKALRAIRRCRIRVGIGRSGPRNIVPARKITPSRAPRTKQPRRRSRRSDRSGERPPGPEPGRAAR